MCAPESRNRKASGSGGVNEDWLGMSWGLAGPDHAWRWSWEGQLNFILCAKEVSEVDGS